MRIEDSVNKNGLVVSLSHQNSLKGRQLAMLLRLTDELNQMFGLVGSPLGVHGLKSLDFSRSNQGDSLIGFYF